MNEFFNMQAFQLNFLYNSLFLHKTKDKIHMVLEPLQSMIQISLLSVLPIGTKLTIQENLLYLQTPSLIQPLNRWYNIDKKDDLYYLFQVVKRFIKWYNPEISKKSPLSKELYQLIIKMSIDGFDNLLKTYNSLDNNPIIQVVNMYKNLLENNDIEIDKIFNDKVNIDGIFENIIEIYEPNLINIIHNTLIIIQKEENIGNINIYINGLNLIMYKNNKVIQNWIKTKLIV